MSEQLDTEVVVVETSQEAVRRADVVLLATTASEPVIRAEWLTEGVRVSSIQTTGSESREVATDVVGKAKIVCDSGEACLAEAGEVLIPIEEGELQEEDV
jgi:ornithine cyclodeaminase/alanine dehydrogenase-like protein (mu-crystallin family)